MRLSAHWGRPVSDIRRFPGGTLMRRAQQDLSNPGYKRTFLALSLACSVLVVWAGSPAVAADIRWRQFEGPTLRVLLSQSHWQAVVGTYLPEFEELTGIKLAVEGLPQAGLWNVLETALKDPGRVDVFMTVPALDGRRYLRAGGVHPVNDFLRNPTLPAKEYRWEAPYATSVYAGVLHATGASWFDGDNRPTVNALKGLAALKFLGNLLGQYGPINV